MAAMASSRSCCPPEFLDPDDLFELFGSAGRFVEPRCGRYPVLVSQVDLIDLSEPGQGEQVGIARRCRYMRWPGRNCPGPDPVAQARVDKDHVKGHSAVGAEDPPAFSQHGELRFQSTEHVGVGDGIEDLATEGQQVQTLARGGHIPVL